MGHLSVKPLADIVVKIIGGGTPSKAKAEYWNGDIPWLSVKDMKDDTFFLDQTQDTITHIGVEESSTNIIPKGTIILSTRMGLGRCLINKVDMAINQDLKALILNEKIISRDYLFYVLKSKSEEIEAMGSGTTVKGIRLDDLKSIEIPLPPLKTQQKIASILSNYDKLIENNTQRIKLLEFMAEELYKEWFVRLRFPGYEDVEVVDDLPVGWERKSIFDISEIVYGYPLKSTLFNDEGKGIPLIRIRDIKNNFSKIFTEENVDNEKYFLRNGDLLVGMDGDFHMGIWSGGHAILNQRVVCFRPKENISKYFFYFAIKKDIDFLNKVISGTTVAHLSDRDLKKINLSVPDENTMNKFKILIDNIFEIKIKLDVKNKNLKQTRDLLLPRLMSGKLNVEDLDII